jgi:hypothetical protein
MSSPLAIGAVSAVLRNLLDNGMIDIGPPIGSVKVTAVAPDTIDLENTASTPSINLFLYRVSSNQGWQNSDLPSRNSNGGRISNPPLALDLHYLVTAYGESDFEAEILLGYAMHLLHERPVLDRAAVRRALNPSPLGAPILPPAFQALSAADLADQMETVKVTPEPMDTEEMSRLWSAVQTHYRPSAAYIASVVLIQAREPASGGLPVLSRGPVDPISGRDLGVVATPSLTPPFPTIERVVPPNEQPAALLGDAIRISGYHLDGTATTVRFSHRLLEDPIEQVVGINTDSSGIDLTLPTGAAADQAWPAGLYTVSASLIRPGELVPRESNVAAMLLAPSPTLPPTTISRDGPSQRMSVTIGVSPALRPEQDATMSLGSYTTTVEPHPNTTTSLDFEFGVVPAGPQWVRLSIDGSESLLVDRTETPPVFDPTQTVTVPA